ncbi:hypothetical protein FACS1894111_10770 [Clostridia bacterium]|nr:hypothetical protein FACS1894111_10770 [Clostridia bacterium]
MKINKKDLAGSILSALSDIHYIKPEDFPNIDLYMDQVTTFMDKELASSKRYAEDKILTKTMINNYAKNDLLPPPTKKKYSREHMYMLMFIYYFKNILSISDIQELLGPVAKNYFGKESGQSMAYIYEQIFHLLEEGVPSFYQDIEEKIKASRTTFSDLDSKKQEEMKDFALICLLGFDIYMKKQLMEQLIDAKKGST